MPSPFPIESSLPIFHVSSSLLFFFFFFFFFPIFSLFLPLSLSHHQPSVTSVFCNNSTSNASRQLFNSADRSFLMNLQVPMRTQSWATISPEPFSSSSSPSPVLYALAQCFGTLTQKECENCFAESHKKLQQCLPSTSGRIYLEGCFLRYERFCFFEQWSDPKADSIKCSPAAGNITQPYLYQEFLKKLSLSFVNITAFAPVHGGFGVMETKGGVNPVYILAQCWKTVSKNDCKSCLKSAAIGVSSCLPRKEGIAMNAGCYMRYSTNKFYEDREIVGSSVVMTTSKVFVIIMVSMITFLVLALAGAFLGYAKLSEKITEHWSLSKVSSTNKSNLNFKYETLEKATDSFSLSRKLGQGGAGSVFRGYLTDGRTVAVKRLFFSTRQWVDDFFNEVNLISGVQHKNLIKLLGCSIEGPESLLVYEFIPNKSLDQFLFGKNKTQILSWEQRINIIIGTAEGLAYLHHGSKTRIIHRDIKCSNILLDENLTAKIADFGLVRQFATDKTHLSTGIAGTMGYMAPEYLVRGQLTEKADVFSFGVLVLEIVCGRRNSVFVQEYGSVLHTVWDHYKSSTFLDSVDPSLRDDYPVEEASNVLQIGLLCTQVSVSSRPSMSEVVQMLTNEDCTIPTPTNPPFLSNSVTSDTTEFFTVCSSSSTGLPMSEVLQPR